MRLHEPEDCVRTFCEQRSGSRIGIRSGRRTAVKYSNGATARHVQYRPDEDRRAPTELLTGDAAPLQAERSQLTLDRHSCTLGGRRRGPYGSRSAPQLLCSCACEQRDHDVGVLVGGFFAAVSRSAACASVSDFDGRPAVPRGTSQSSSTLRFTRSRACATADGLAQDREEAVRDLRQPAPPTWTTAGCFGRIRWRNPL